MKANFFTLITLTVLMACGKTTNDVESLKSGQMNLVVLLYDISTSTDSYAMLTDLHLASLYDKMGPIGGGKVYGLHIKTNSILQDPIIADIPGLELMPLQGNAYQRANRERRNEQLETDFEKTKDAFVKSVSGKLILPKDHRYSDVENALRLAQGIFENSAYSPYRKNLVIICDMENNHPSKPGYIDPMDPVQFNSDVNVAIVRPSAGVNIDEMLTGTNYTSFISIDDALNALFTN